MLIRSWILGITIVVASSELTGDNICELEESYPVNVTEYSWRNVTVRDYEWCMGFPPRCSFYTLKTVRVPTIIEKYETRIVKRCCSGYAENSRHDGCVECRKCFYGLCGNEGKCICNAGFKGDECSEACEAMQWGIDCHFGCLCERGNCDPRTGQCDCPSGWFGTRCELSCLEGFYGKHCIHRCNCGERELCSSQTGQCATKSTYRQEHQSTRAIHYLTEEILNFTKIITKQKSTPALKKYHTFDMDLSTNKPFYSGTTETLYHTFPMSKNEKFNPNSSSKPKLNISTHNESNIRLPKTNRTSFKTTRKKSDERNREKSKINGKEENIDSTTEISAEIAHHEGILPLLNENESLENNYSKETMNTSKLKHYIGKNITEITDTGISTNDKISSEISNKKKFDKSLKHIKIKILSPDGNELLKGQKSKEANRSWSRSEKTIQIDVFNSNLSNTESLNYKNYISNFTTPRMKQTAEAKLKKNKKEQRINNHRGSSEEHINNKNISRKTPSKTQKEIISKTANSKQNIPKFKNATFHRTNDNSKEVKNTETVTKSYDFVMSISPILESTSPILKYKKQHMASANSTVVERNLENLDNAILTSRDTSTPIATTQETATVREKVLPFPDELPSMKSTMSLSNIGNELFTTSSTELRTPLKYPFDFHQNKEDNNYLSDEASGEFDHHSTDKSNLVTHVSIAVSISFILVVIMSSMILTHYYTRRRKKPTSKLRSEHHQNYPGGPTVSVYTHSIFHTPLPDPPTFENPVFSSPSENTIDHRTFHTHLVCSLNFPGHHRPDEKEYTYDHPPSTGSYRAASIPEPPDISETVTAEPLYDEIPCNLRDNKTSPPSYKSSCIYVNTCGKTKF